MKCLNLSNRIYEQCKKKTVGEKKESFLRGFWRTHELLINFIRIFTFVNYLQIFHMYIYIYIYLYMYKHSYYCKFRKKNFLEFFVTILKRLTSERIVTKVVRELLF